MSIRSHVIGRLKRRTMSEVEEPGMFKFLEFNHFTEHFHFCSVRSTFYDGDLMETRRSSEIERSWQRVPFPFHAGGCNCMIHEQFSTLCVNGNNEGIGPTAFDSRSKYEGKSRSNATIRSVEFPIVREVVCAKQCALIAPHGPIPPQGLPRASHRLSVNTQLERNGTVFDSHRVSF